MSRSSQSLLVYRADALRVVNGANLGDGLDTGDEMVCDDLYRLSPIAMPKPLALRVSAEPPFNVATDSALGTPGHAVHLDCCATFMSGLGETSDCLILVETDPEGDIAQIYALPLAPMTPRADYVLVGLSREGVLQRFAQIACTSFTAGTLITLATGAQKPVEALKPGDRVLTRDDGPRELRWIGHHTVRAQGAFAPICIRAGVLNNARDLLLSPEHRLFIYQRQDALGAGRSELLIRARHLVNGETITVTEGGFVDYYQMLFDAHQIVYAEGIAAESMLMDQRTRPALPADLQEKLGALVPGHRRSDISGLEIGEALLSRPDAAELLRKSSGG